MANYNYTVGELASQIKTEGKMNIGHLGNPDSQNTFIYYYITEVLWELVAEIKKKKTSDPLVVTSNGYVTFQVASSNIEDLYAPLRILTPNEVSGTQLQRRTSFDAPLGWFRESQNDLIHIKGAGTYILQYIAYPTKASSPDQILDIPQTSYGLVKDRVIARIKESLNDLEGIKLANQLADNKVPNLIKANKDAMIMMG